MIKTINSIKGNIFILIGVFAFFLLSCNNESNKKEEGIKIFNKTKKVKSLIKQIELTQESLEYAKKNDIDTLESESYFRLGALYLMQKKNDSAYHYLTKAQSAYQTLGYQNRIIRVNATLINHNCTIGNHQEAMQLVVNTDRLINNQNEPNESILFYYLQKARFYYHMEIPDSVLSIANYADSLSKSINSDKFRPQFKSIKGVIYSDLGKHTLAISCYKDVLDQYGPYELDKGIMLTNIGNSYAKNSNVDSSIHYFNRALNLYNTIDAGETVINTMKMDISYALSKLDANISQDYYSQVDSTHLPIKKRFFYQYIKSAFSSSKGEKEKSLLKALSFTQKLDFPAKKLKLMCYSDLHVLYSELGQYKNALENFEKHAQLNSEMKEEESFFKMEKLNLINNVREKDRKIQSQETLIVQKNDFIVNQNIKIYSFAVFAILLLFILLLLRKNYKTKIKLKEIELQKIELTKKILMKEMDPISQQLESANETIKMAKIKLSEVSEGNEKNQVNNVKINLNQWLTNFEDSNDTIAAQKLIGSNFLTELDKYQDLTDSEKKVIILIKQGYKSKEISDRLNLALNTVEIYRSRIRKKLTISPNESLRKAINNI